MRLAKKKITGGWKILQEFCGECAREDRKKGDEDASAHSGKSGNSRRSRRSAASGCRSRSEAGETVSEHSTSQSEEVRRKLVKKMSYTDEHGDEGLYTGYVNPQYKPHGRGKMVYDNGAKYDGTWSEGSKVHGKTTQKPRGVEAGGGGKESGGKSGGIVSGKSGGKAGLRNASPFGRRAGVGSRTENGNNGGKASKLMSPDKDKDGEKSQPSSSQKQPSQRPQQQQPDLYKEYCELYNASAKVVKNMKFIDFYGDPGRYTGEVNDQKMPHGMGEMTYDHGLVQEGKWVGE